MVGQLVLVVGAEAAVPALFRPGSAVDRGSARLQGRNSIDFFREVLKPQTLVMFGVKTQETCQNM